MTLNFFYSTEFGTFLKISAVPTTTGLSVNYLFTIFLRTQFVNEYVYVRTTMYIGRKMGLLKLRLSHTALSVCLPSDEGSNSGVA